MRWKVLWWWWSHALLRLVAIHNHQLIKAHEPLPISHHHPPSSSQGVGSACAWPNDARKLPCAKPHPSIGELVNFVSRVPHTTEVSKVAGVKHERKQLSPNHTPKAAAMIQLKVPPTHSLSQPTQLTNHPPKTMLNVIDNSGAAVAECINVLKMNRAAKVGTSSPLSLSLYTTTVNPLTHIFPPTGDRIIVVVQKQRNFGPESGPGGSVSVSAANKVRRGDIRHAVVVRTAKQYSRPDGSVVKFDDNACVLINKGGEPIGSRLSSVVGQELRGKKWSKILSLAPMHL